MDKRYQVFISSTFRDLIEERQAVLKAVLELDHMPAGMELFPAADEDAWQLIQDVIDSSDYYILILGGRYGSLDSEGIGYTEKEYHYAVQQKKPVIPLLHKTPDNLPRDKTETDSKAWEKLQAFRNLVESTHTCVYWENTGGLKSNVIIGLTHNTKRQPAIGWVRADKMPSKDSLRESLELRARIDELESELNKAKTEAPSGTEDLRQGSDRYQLQFDYQELSAGSYSYSDDVMGAFDMSWDDLFAGAAPTLISEAKESQLRKAVEGAVQTHFTDYLHSLDPALVENKYRFFKFRKDEIDTVIVQFRALGLIVESDKKRSITDTATYWKLTPYGDRKMVQLRALRKPSN